MTDVHTLRDTAAPVPPAPLAPRIDRKRRFSPIWLIPIVAALVGVYLAWVTQSEKGPTITITFETADGLEAGKTLIKHKEVVFGTVTSLALTEDLSHVVVTAEMTNEAAPHLRQGTRFWVVRPRLSATGGLSGLSTLISGAYIELDPGPGDSARHFTGLEDPPVVRADMAGTAYILKADRIGSVGPGSPVFFRDVQVGEVMGFDSSDLEVGVTIHAFVRAPYDRYVHDGTRFWNASGISIGTGPEGFKVQLESLAAVLAGGIAFDTPATARIGEPSKAGTAFTLYPDATGSEEAAYTIRLPYLVHFHGSVRGLAPDAPVEWRGIKVGRVVDLKLEYDVAADTLRIPVVIELEPQRVALVGEKQGFGTGEFMPELVRRGLRAQLKTASLLTGELMVSLDFFPDAPPETMGTGERYPVIPSVPDEFAAAMQSVSGILEKVSALPLDKVVQQVDATLKSFETLAASPDITASLRSLAEALTATRDLVSQANTDLGPIMDKLPPLLTTAQQATQRLSGTLASVNSGYGNDSTFRRDLVRLMSQVDDTLRSVRVLTDYLEQHPESLIRGKAGGG
ncbi:MCE family protein [Mycobacterium sp. KBS0706]|uniref:PqiB family protein n=1 Tax=Mycobacterium sp. KBS0706 TaxID=2578109 RepID=UPI00110F6E16|nr:MlaD family protein [Mycobacterium sp. KBS0706]TSD83744.1 MCE family protein [Mycobacterium sp. KBS0706]